MTKCTGVSATAPDPRRGGSGAEVPSTEWLKTVGRIDDVHEMTGRIAGRLLGVVSSRETIDPLVVATAMELGGAVVLTGDFRDMEAPGAGRGDVVVQPP